MGFFGDVMSQSMGNMANTFQKYSRDSRIDDDKRAELADKADRWREMRRGFDDWRDSE